MSEPLWWMSFSDPGRPEGEQFLGALVMPGYTFTAALTESHLRGLNPGGEVMYVRIPDDKVDLVPEDQRMRLLTREEVDAL